MKVRELLNSKEKWCKTYYALNVFGEDTASAGEDAVRWCLVGALRKCYLNSKDQYAYAYNKVLAALQCSSLAEFNDAPSTTFENVKELVEKLDI